MNADTEKPSWFYRRIAVFVSMAFCMLGIGYLTLFGEENRLNETLALGYFGVLAAVIGYYVAGAAWDDKNFMSNIQSRLVERRHVSYDPPPLYPDHRYSNYAHYRDPREDQYQEG